MEKTKPYIDSTLTLLLQREVRQSISFSTLKFLFEHHTGRLLVSDDGSLHAIVTGAKTLRLKASHIVEDTMTYDEPIHVQLTQSFK